MGACGSLVEPEVHRNFFYWILSSNQNGGLPWSRWTFSRSAVTEQKPTSNLL